MAADQPDDLPVVELTTPPCEHLRSKGMYVYTDGFDGQMHEDDDSTNYWCFLSMKSFGPDDNCVGRLACRDTSRSCYEAI